MIMKHRGFSLLEIFITLAIMGILATLAYPCYTPYLARARRIEGEVALLALSTQLEKFFTANTTYVGATLADLGVSAISPGGHYALEITQATAHSYTLSAAPLGIQAQQDRACGSLGFNSLGEKTHSGPSDHCW